jgi:hypothetical protein
MASTDAGIVMTGAELAEIGFRLFWRVGIEAG